MASKNNRGGVQVRVHRTNLNDGYLITPNELFRGAGLYAGLNPHERILLGAGLSCKDEWDTTLEKIEEWLPGLGRDRHEAVRRTLRERGFMTMTPDRIPAGNEDGGRFRWVIAFYMDPLPEDERDKLNEKKPRQGEPGRTVPGSSGHGDSGQKTPVQTMPGSSGHGQPGHGQPGPGGQGALYKEEKNEGLEELNPPLPPVIDPPAVVPGPRTGEGEKSDDNTRDMLAAALEQAHALKPGWRPDAMRAAMLAEISGGRSAAAVARAIVELAKDSRSDGPGRLKVAGPWWNADAGAVVDGPVRYIERDAPRCRAHRGEPGDGCGKCKAEQFVPEYDREREQHAAPADPAAAREMMRKINAASSARYKQSTRPGPVQPVTADRRSSALAALTEAAERLTRAHEMPAGDQEQTPEPVRELANVAAS